MSILTKEYRLVWDPVLGIATEGKFDLNTKTETLKSVFESDDEASFDAKIIELGFPIPESDEPEPPKDAKSKK